MVLAWIAMIRFPLRMLLLESGQYDGTLVICVARLGKRGRGVFRGRGVNRKNTVIEIRHKSDILGMMQSNWCSGTAKKIIIKGLAHQIPPDLSVRHNHLVHNESAKCFPLTCCS